MNHMDWEEIYDRIVALDREIYFSQPAVRLIYENPPSTTTRRSKMMPIAKVSVGAATGALTAIIVWGLKAFGQIEVPAEIAVALSTVLSFIASYITPLEEQ